MRDTHTYIKQLEREDNEYIGTFKKLYMFIWGCHTKLIVINF